MSDEIEASGRTGGGRDYELADEFNASEPTRFKALGDPLRLLILDLVLERALTVTELAERTGRPKGSVAYHVDVLVEAGLLRVVRTRKVRAVEERFYGRVARTILIPDQPGEIPFLRDVLADIDIERPDADQLAGGFTFRHARIPRERAEEYVRRLYALSLEFIDEPRGGDVEYGMYVALFPTNRLPKAPAET
jgi:DNA-binding transcriptional ArsR family regulator